MGSCERGDELSGCVQSGGLLAACVLLAEQSGRSRCPQSGCALAGVRVASSMSDIRAVFPAGWSAPR
jgi:hypothetical protein